MTPRKSGNSPRIALAGASIVLPRRADEMLRFAGAELARYLYLLTRRLSAVTNTLPRCGPAVVISAGEPAGGISLCADAGEQGYILRAMRRGRQPLVAIWANSSIGALYGVYGLLEEMGMGFYAGGDTFPDLPARAEIPAALDHLAKPVFKVRGNMLHYNFLCGCTDWGLADYKFYFDQLSRMRMNLLLMHWYDHEPGAAYEINGEYLAGGRTPNSLSKPWGALAALHTREFSFGTGRFFGEDIFTSPAGHGLPDRITEIKRTEEMFACATLYAKQRGVAVAAGFEAPNRASPTDAEAARRFRERLRQFVERNPHLAYFALWQHESGGCAGNTPPPQGSAARAFMEKQRPLFSYLGGDHRVWEAIRFGGWAQIAAEWLANNAPRLRLVLVGWGGDRWMRFADYCLGYDRILPKSVIFTCHDNIDASFGREVSAAWGMLPPDRERWAMPWVEGDIDECITRQPNVESLAALAPDALNKGCQGFLTLHWRTRDIEEEIGFAARFAWDPTLTAERFYDIFGCHAFGEKNAKRMSRIVGALQRLGARWTGVRGSVECGHMTWTGWRPHFPFELDAVAVRFLAARAEEASRALAIVPAEASADGAFHLRQARGKKEKRDPARFGVAEMAAVAKRLRGLARMNDREELRARLAEIREETFGLRAELIRLGMSSQAFRAFDGFVFALHHAIRNAGATEKMARLRRLSAEVADVRKRAERAGDHIRLERLDYLSHTMDLALAMDSVAMLLADGERIDQALAQAKAARQRGNAREAAQIAGRAYRDLIDAGFHRVFAAAAGKLTTRCDWGVLVTLNVKQAPAYWQSIAALEEFMLATPPREISGRGQRREVWLSWEPAARAAGLNLYRRPLGSRGWQRVNRRPLDKGCTMFIDRPKPGRYEYALAAVSEDGWESPLSHPIEVSCGSFVAAPRIIGVIPFSHARAGEAIPIEAIVVADREIAEVAVRYCLLPGPWQCQLLIQCFRNAYRAIIPAEAIKPGVLLWQVEARDVDGRVSRWPLSAQPGLPWSMTITP